MRKIKLGDVLDVKRGASLSGEFYSEQGERIRLTLGNFKYPGGGFKENTSKKDIYFTGAIKPEFILKKGDIITPLTEQVSGLLGETARVPKDDIYIQSGDIGLVIPNERALDKDFAYYLVSSPVVKKQLDAAAQQTKIRHTSPDAIKECEAYLSELLEQKKIAALLDAINGKIANNNAICADLEGMAKLLYDYWFVQFDFPDENGKPYKSSGGKMVWNEELKREIPEGWEVVSLGTQFSITMGTSPEGKSINENEEGVPFYQGKTDFGFRFPAVRTYTTTPIRYAYRGDTLLSVRAPVGALNRAIETCCIGRGVASIHADEFPSYAYYTSLSLRPRFEKYNGDGTTFGCIGRDDLFAIPAVKPERSLIEKFEKITRQIDAKIENAEMENTELASLRDFLLPMLMNGQVKAKGA